MRAVAVKTRAVSRIAKVLMPTITRTNSKNGMTLGVAGVVGIWLA
jgi:hypothetical protein